MKVTDTASRKFRFALHEYFQPLLLSIIGAMAGVILWFGMKAYEKIDTLDSKITQVMVSMGEVKANNVSLVECSNKTQRDADNYNKEIKFIEIALAGKGITIKRNN